MMTRAIPLFVLLLVCAPLQAQNADYASPRATVTTFVDAMEHVERQQGDVEAAWSRALGALDAAQLDDAAARTAARDLSEVLDKLGPLNELALPGKASMAEREQRRYTFYPRPQHKDFYDKLGEEAEAGRIVLQQADDGRWLFTAETLATIGALADAFAPVPPTHGEAPADSETDHLWALLGTTFEQTKLWQWGALAGCIFLGLLAGRIVSYTLRKLGDNWLNTHQWTIRGTILHDFASPVSLALFTLGLYVGLMVFVQLTDNLRDFVQRVIAFLFILAVGWLLYNLIDVVEVALRRITDKTESKLDDMVVPLVRKTLRIFLVIVFALVAAENVFGMDVTGFLAGLGIAGLAVSLAAQDSLKNLFGSLTVFFDKPFLVGDFITYDGETGGVEEIGFRSTRIRLLSGHLVTVPNMKFIDSKVENISMRPHIRRQMDVTITYDTPAEKIEQAVQILREVLNDAQVIEQGMFDMENNPPRIAFNEFNAASLNIRAYYWYKIPAGSDRGFFTFLDHAQLVNLMLFRRYAEAGIDFAFPTQTIYLADDEKRRLTVKLDRGQE